MRHDACRLMYVSDIHLRRTRSDNLCRQVIESARSSEIDVILLGGDLVDGPAELARLCELVGALCEVAPVLAVGGNHDRHVGMNRVGDAVVRGGGKWIHEGAARVSHGSRVIAVSGPDAGFLPEGDFRVLCAHNPRVWKTARQHGYDLVLAGHLHGCQVVAFEFRDRLSDLKILFRIAMQCQIIDDVLDYSKDMSAGLPSFLTAAKSLPQAMELTRLAALGYADDRDLPRTGDVFPLRSALVLVSTCTKLVLFLGRLRQRTRAGRNFTQRVYGIRLLAADGVHESPSSTTSWQGSARGRGF